jgi:hypothetical protein
MCATDLTSSEWFWTERHLGGITTVDILLLLCFVVGIYGSMVENGEWQFSFGSGGVIHYPEPVAIFWILINVLSRKKVRVSFIVHSHGNVTTVGTARC